jgi:steroid delta-isomerase-like uncharacterized protein
MATDLKQLARRIIDEAWNKGKLAVIDELVSPSYVNNDPNLPMPVRGPEGLKQQIQYFRAAFPDLAIKIDDQVVEGNKIVTRWTATGTQKGEFFGVPPTGKKATTVGMTLARFDGGKMAEDFPSWDALGLMRKLGVVPAPAGA